MRGELTNGAEARVGANLRGSSTVARYRTFMEMSNANKLGDEQQRRAEDRDRTDRRSAAFMEARYHEINRSV